jgi:hypothetical protein
VYQESNTNFAVGTTWSSGSDDAGASDIADSPSSAGAVAGASTGAVDPVCVRADRSSARSPLPPPQAVTATTAPASAAASALQGLSSTLFVSEPRTAMSIR